jgi:hypothetical protein
MSGQLDDAIIAAILAQEAFKPSSVNQPQAPANAEDNINTSLQTLESSLLDACEVSLSIPSIGQGFGMVFSPGVGLMVSSGSSQSHWDEVPPLIKALAVAHAGELQAQGLKHSIAYQTKLLSQTASAEVSAETNRRILEKEIEKHRVKIDDMKAKITTELKAVEDAVAKADEVETLDELINKAEALINIQIKADHEAMNDVTSNYIIQHDGKVEREDVSIGVGSTTSADAGGSNQAAAVKGPEPQDPRPTPVQ